MTAPFDPARIAAETLWLKANPQFDEKPASIKEFLGPEYLDLGNKVRPGLEAALVEIFGEEVSTDRIASVQRAMITGAIGIGKTTFASIALPYMVHWVLCLHDPQDFYDLLPGSRIAFMQMSTSEAQAREVIFGDVFARIKHSPWFVQNAHYDDKFTKQIRFPQKDIWILPGDSAETTFEGYNILGGVLDEMDSHKITKEKDYADLGYNTIHARIFSRFEDQGLLILIGQMKKANGFAARKYAEYLLDPGAFVCRMTLWESLGWARYTAPNGEHDSFFYDIKRKSLVPKAVAELIDPSKRTGLIEIPNMFRPDFMNNPEVALRDLAGIPPATSDPFISLVDRIEDCRDAWIRRHGPDSPVDDNPSRPTFASWFRAPDTRKRVLHLDMAYSPNGDALGMAMGYVEGLMDKDGEKKPIIIFDFLMRIKALPGTEIFFPDIRNIIYDLRDDLNFKIDRITLDGFQSIETTQQLRKRRFKVDYLSVDKSTLPYEDLREAIYDRRLEFPPYVTHLSKGDTKTEEVAIRELMEISFDGKKVDHPPNGSKDVADGMAAVTSTLMGVRAYRRGLANVDAYHQRRDSMPRTGTDGSGFGDGLQAPLPPSGVSASRIEVPRHLRR